MLPAMRCCVLGSGSDAHTPPIPAPAKCPDGGGWEGGAKLKVRYVCLRDAEHMFFVAGSRILAPRTIPVRRFFFSLSLALPAFATGTSPSAGSTLPFPRRCGQAGHQEPLVFFLLHDGALIARRVSTTPLVSVMFPRSPLAWVYSIPHIHLSVCSLSFTSGAHARGMPNI